jgi:hypothetical protein
MVLIFKNFLSDNECNKLNEWVNLGIQNKWLDKGTNRGSDWAYEKRLTTRLYAKRFDYSLDVYDIQNKISNFLNIIDLPKSTIGGGKNGIVVSCTYDGGDVYEHIDPKKGNLEVLRCNIMTRAADNGGGLYVGGNKIDIKVGDLHCYLPSTVKHYVTEVKGKTSRVLWMFGYQCSIERFNQLCQHHQQILK